MSARWPQKWFMIGGVVLLTECVLKYLAWKHRHEQELLNVPGYLSFNIVYVENRHSAFSMMRNFPEWINFSLLGLSVVVLGVLTYQQIKSTDSTEIMRRGIFCFIVGAVGNLIDRALLGGAVVDYIDIRLGENGSWYALAWNISDLVINLGFAHVMYESAFHKEIVEVAVAKKTDGDSTPPAVVESEPRAARVRRKTPLSPRNSRQ
jgi:signal peptidase II